MSNVTAKKELIETYDNDRNTEPCCHKRQSTWLVFSCFLATLLCGSKAIAQGLYQFIDPFPLARYGLGYDLSAERQAASGQPCINFDEDPQNMFTDIVGAGIEFDTKTITSTYDLVDKMNLTASAQMKSINQEINLGLDILKESEIHRFSQTDMFWSYNIFNTVSLKAESLSYKPSAKELLNLGVLGADRFMARCGDAFVIGMKKAGFYYGTSSIKKEETSNTDKIKISFDIKYNSGTSYKAASAYEKNRKESNIVKKVELKVKTSDSTLAGAKPVNLKELRSQWRTFTPSLETSQPISLVLAPYSVIGIDQKGVLEESPTELKLKILLRGLWDLKTIIEEGGYILRHQDDFAFGLPKSKILIKHRKNSIKRTLTQWRKEKENLIVDTKSCMKNFTKTCNKLADWYKNNPRITERNLLPKKKDSLCYGEFIINSNMEGEKIKFDARKKGDSEMGGGPILLTSAINIWRDERQLKFQIRTEAEENKSDHSTFVASKIFTLFDLDPEHPEMGDMFKECEFAKPFINKNPVKGKITYGIIEGQTGKNPRGFIPFDGVGILKQLHCKLDKKGNDYKMAVCERINMTNFQILLQSKLDREAQSWDFPKFIKVPTLASLKPVKPWKPKINVEAQKPILNNKLR